MYSTWLNGRFVPDVYDFFGKKVKEAVKMLNYPVARGGETPAFYASGAARVPVLERPGPDGEKVCCRPEMPTRQKAPPGLRRGDAERAGPLDWNVND